MLLNAQQSPCELISSGRLLQHFTTVFFSTHCSCRNTQVTNQYTQTRFWLVDCRSHFPTLNVTRSSSSSHCMPNFYFFFFCSVYFSIKAESTEITVPKYCATNWWERLIYGNSQICWKSFLWHLDLFHLALLVAKGHLATFHLISNSSQL